MRRRFVSAALTEARGARLRRGLRRRCGAAVAARVRQQARVPAVGARACAAARNPPGTTTATPERRRGSTTGGRGRCGAVMTRSSSIGQSPTEDVLKDCAVGGRAERRRQTGASGGRLAGCSAGGADRATRHARRRSAPVQRGRARLRSARVLARQRTCRSRAANPPLHASAQALTDRLSCLSGGAQGENEAFVARFARRGAGCAVRRAPLPRIQTRSVPLRDEFRRKKLERLLQKMFRRL